MVYMDCGIKGGEYMGIYSFDVKLSLDETIKKLDSEIIQGTITEKIDFHEIHSECKNKAVVIVYGKRYFRAGNRLTLTLCIEELKDRTHIHVISISGIEVGASDDGEVSRKFTSFPRKILEEYII